jgi:Uma2 family endonuclease
MLLQHRTLAMTAITNQRMTIEEYLNFDDGTDARYELVSGELVEMPSASDLNNVIAMFLLIEFSRFVPAQLLRRGTEVVTSGFRSTARIPDLIVLTEEAASALVGSIRSIILPDMPPPALVVKLVSPGTLNEQRDYRYKRSEYAARGIADIG